MIEFYKNIWKGNFDGSDKELEKLLSVSSDIISNEIFLSGYTIEEIPDIFSDSVKKAICSQADFISNNGGIEALNNHIQSVTVGKFSFVQSGCVISHTNRIALQGDLICLQYLKIC